jgi:hypothetical protein
MAAYNNNNRKARESTLKVGDLVLLQQLQANKSMPVYDPKPWTITAISHSSATIQRPRSGWSKSQELFRDLALLKLYKEPQHNNNNNNNQAEYFDVVKNNNTTPVAPPPPQQPPPLPQLPAYQSAALTPITPAHVILRGQQDQSTARNELDVIEQRMDTVINARPRRTRLEPDRLDRQTAVDRKREERERLRKRESRYARLEIHQTE